MHFFCLLLLYIVQVVIFKVLEKSLEEARAHFLFVMFGEQTEKAKFSEMQSGAEIIVFVSRRRPADLCVFNPLLYI